MNTPAEELSNKNSKIMAGVFGVLTLIFFCGGTAVVGFIGAEGSESEGVMAAMAATGPGCCSCSGLLAALIGLFALRGKNVAQFIVPIVAGVIGGLVGGVGIVIFFEAIFPAL